MPEESGTKQQISNIIENTDGDIVFHYKEFIGDNIWWIIFGVLFMGIVIGFFIGKKIYNKRNEAEKYTAVFKLYKKAKDLIKSFFKAVKENNVQTIVQGIAIFMLAMSIVFEFLGIQGGITTLVMNVFASFVISWIATEKSAEIELKKQEEITAKKSRRYLDSIKTSTQNAKMIIKEYEVTLDQKNERETIVVLERALDQVKGIEAGIQVAIQDWEEWMSAEDLKNLRSDVAVNKDVVVAAKKTVPNFDEKTFLNDNSEQQNEA